MNDRAILLLAALLRTGIILSAAAMGLSLLLRLFHISSPALRRAACAGVVLQGWLLVQYPLPAPFAAEDLAARHRVPESQSIVPNQTDSLRPVPSNSRIDFGPPQALDIRMKQATRARGIPWATAIVVLWGTGIVVLVGRSGLSYARFARQLSAAHHTKPEGSAEWTSEWEAVQRIAGLRTLARLVVAEQTGPLLCRLPGGYRLVVPARTWRTLDSAERVLVLRHELAHIVRRDVWKSLALRVLALPHWFNPLVWRVVRQFDECAEWACDEAARRSDPENVAKYARALLHLSHRAEPLFFATRAAQGRGLYQRIRLLLSPAKKKDSVMKKTVLATLLVVLSLVNATRLESRAAVPTLAADTPAEEKPKRPAATPLAAPARAAKLGIKDGVLYVDLYDNELTIPSSALRQRGQSPPYFDEASRIPAPPTKAQRRRQEIRTGHRRGG